MIVKDVDVSVNGSAATLSTYFIDNLVEVLPNRRRPVVIVLPGGCYEFLAEREAEPIALAMVAQGLHACVLNYSVAPATFPQALLEVMRAVSWLRANADEYHIDPDRIVVAGFSAGGHLAGSAGCFWQEDFVAEALGEPAEAHRPNGIIMGYPVVTSGEFAHRDSFKNITGGDAAAEPALSLETRVTASMPPTFLWATVEDQLVPVENTLLMGSALQRAGVNFEMHVFPHGPHGVALGTEETADPSDPAQAGWIQPQASYWPRLAAIWAKSL